MERLNFNQNNDYRAIEGAIHLNRYLLAKGFCKDRVVLDIACGEGYGSYLLSQWGAKQVYGVDISQESIEIAKEKFSAENIKYFCKNAEDISEIKSKSVDTIVSFETIEHVEYVERYLSEMKRMIKEDGTIIISCPNDWWYFPEENQKNPFHLRKYHLEEFINQCSTILGEPSSLYIGNKVEGFSNIKIERINRKSQLSGQLKMIEFQDIDTYIIAQDETISDKNSSYFLAVWSTSKAIEKKENAVLYPTIFNPKGSAVEIELREMLEDARSQIINKETCYLEMLEDVRSQIINKETCYLEMLEDVKSQLKNANALYNQEKREKSKYLYNYSAVADQMDELQIKIVNTKEKYGNLKKKYEEQNNILQEIYRSKAWKIIRHYYNIWDGIRSKK